MHIVESPAQMAEKVEGEFFDGYNAFKSVGKDNSFRRNVCTFAEKCEDLLGQTGRFGTCGVWALLFYASECWLGSQKRPVFLLNNIKSNLMKLEIADWGLIPYEEAWKRQKECFSEVVAAKQAEQAYANRIVLCEHPSVYTLGRSGKECNMLLGGTQLQRLGVPFYHIDRGGDITYHGPGQVVCYPILNLEDFSLGLRDYIYVLEEAVIRLCAAYGIGAGRLEKATGVWLEGDTPRARKICAIGVHASHFVTMHGLALNVNTDLRYFSYIHPCGFVDKGVTSLQKELHREVPMEEVKERLCSSLLDLLGGA